MQCSRSSLCGGAQAAACGLPERIQRLAAFGFAYPPGKQGKARNDEDNAGRNPHNQSPKLLVLERREPPRSCSSVVDRVPRRLCEGHHSAEEAGMKCRSKDIDKGHPITEPPISPVDERVPKQECAH